jgi:hypothetical protein
MAASAGGAAFDKIADVGIPLLADWRLQRDRFLHDLEAGVSESRVTF